jgi:hypothetical protein
LSATSFWWKRNISVEGVDLRSPHISLLARPRWSNSLYFIRMSGSLTRSKSLLVPSFGWIQICIRSLVPIPLVYAGNFLPICRALHIASYCTGVLLHIFVQI